MLAPIQNVDPYQPEDDTTFEPHYSVADLAKQWRLGRETVRLLVKEEPWMVFHPCHHPLEIATRFPQFHSPDDDDSLLSPRGHFYWATQGDISIGP